MFTIRRKDNSVRKQVLAELEASQLTMSAMDAGVHECVVDAPPQAPAITSKPRQLLADEFLTLLRELNALGVTYVIKRKGSHLFLTTDFSATVKVFPLNREGTLFVPDPINRSALIAMKEDLLAVLDKSVDHTNQLIQG